MYGVWCMLFKTTNGPLQEVRGELLCLQFALEALDTVVESAHPHSTHGPTNIQGVNSVHDAPMLQASPIFVVQPRMMFTIYEYWVTSTSTI